MKAPAFSNCHPLTLTRALEEFPIGNRSLRQHHEELRRQFPGLSIRPQAWVDASELSTGTLVDASGEPLAWTGQEPDLRSPRTAQRSFLLRFPWDLLRANEQFLASLCEGRIEGKVHASAVIEGTLHLGKGSRILPGVFIEGNVVIGEHCTIGPNCYVRGASSIGNHCRIGQSVEIKNSLILNSTKVAHLSFVGDSILGENVNLGAGTIISNFRHDGATHRSLVDGELVDTERIKFGAIVGDRVHTGIHTSIYPGRKLWPGTTTLPGEIVRKDQR
jgi:carbonic anhydrase/acetyltransferase-like protein (isoleucine patch superfamily)